MLLSEGLNYSILMAHPTYIMVILSTSLIGWYRKKVACDPLLLSTPE
jgi:hypothetical protein